MSALHSGNDYMTHFNEKAYLQEFYGDVFIRTDQFADIFKKLVRRMYDTFKNGMFSDFHFSHFLINYWAFTMKLTRCS